MDADVVVVGAGAAGYCAAAEATAAGRSVVVLEAGEKPGGTSAKSSGGFWIPNSHLLREAGKSDPREDALRHMATLSFPSQFDPDDETLGLEQRDYDLIALYYDRAPAVIEGLEARGDLRTMYMAPFKQELEGLGPWHVTDWDRAPLARLLAPQRTTETSDPASNSSAQAMRVLGGKQGDGAELVRQLRAAAESRGARTLVNHRVRRVTTDDAGAVTGVVAETPDGAVTIQARGAVIFTTGGFSHESELAERFLRGPIVGSAAVTTNRGDFVRIAEELGAELGNMREGWWCQLPLETSLVDESPEDFIGFQHGDSALMVNRAGVRVVNEKKMYNERTKVHFVRDEDGDYPNRLLFMIWDEAVAQDPLQWPSRWPVPYPGEHPSYVLEGQTLAELAERLSERLAGLADHTGGLTLEPGFAAQLEATVKRFNEFARSGVDEDFGRGGSVSDLNFNPPAREGNPANPTMFPLRDSGPYYAVIVGAATMDTKGGPRVDASSRVLRPGGEPIPRLYAAGNCMSSATGEAYWGGGSTLGPALTFGAIAGMSAAAEPLRETAAETAA